MAQTKIEWATDVWNPVTGCTPVSAGCDHCYAKRMANRLRGRYGYPQDEPFRVTLHPDRLDQPLKWRKPRMIFVCSMGDLFHRDVPNEFICSVWSRMAQCPRHIFIVLTKRPNRMANFVDHCGVFSSLSNIWLGVSVEDQKTADERIPILLEVPAAVRVVSIEPMLSEIRLVDDIGTTRRYLGRFVCHECQDDPGAYECKCCTLKTEVSKIEEGINWIVCGGETGPGARPMHPEWVEAIKHQCVEAGVSFFFKSWGEWDIYGIDMFRVGKKKAGRLLYGKEWNQRPGGLNANL